MVVLKWFVESDHMSKVFGFLFEYFKETILTFNSDDVTRFKDWVGYNDDICLTTELKFYSWTNLNFIIVLI
jgi:hypothetical protein